MKPNPYESPQGNAPKPRRWGRRCLLSAAVAMLAFCILLLVGYIRPFGLLSDGPSTSIRQAAAGVILVVQLGFYGGILSAIACALVWLINRGGS